MKGSESGFTLIELIVVVLIVGIIVSMSGLSFNQAGGERLLTEDAKRIAAKLNLLSQEATISGRQYAVRLHQQGLEYWIYAEGGWVKIEKGQVYRPQRWRENYRVTLQVEGERLKLPQQDVMQPAPQIYLLSSGEITPFTLLISLLNGLDATLLWQVKGVPTGKITAKKVSN